MSGESPLVIPDSAERVNKGFGLTGKTEQVTTRGVNLFDASLAKSKENYKDVTIKGAIIRAIELDLKPNTKYAFQCVIRSVSTTMNVGNSTIRYVVSDGQKRVITTNEDGKLYVGFTGNVDREIGKIGVSIVDIQVEEGDTQTTYEPYTGGKPSPSPEYPQEIKSVGKWNDEKQKYEVDVKVSNCGYLQKGSYADKIRPLPLEKGKTYRIYVDVKSAVVNVGILNEERTFANSGQLYAYYNSRGYPISSTGVVSGICRLPNSLYRGYTFTVTVDGLFLYQGVNANILNTDNAYVAYDFIKKVDISSPYTEKESVVLTSDRPITKWDKLVEQGGEIGWLYQSKIIDGFDGQSSNITLGGKQGEVQHFSVVFTDVPNGNGNGDIYVDRYRAIAMSYTKAEFGICCNWNSGVKFFSAPNENVTTVQEFKTWLAENPLVLVYETTNPEFVPLPQSEQNAIRALKAYYPTTVITADGGELDLDIEVTYTADTKNYIDNKFAQLQKSLVNTNTQLL